MDTPENDDREAFDKLKRWANDESHPFSKRSKDALTTIFINHDPVFYGSDMTILWPNDIDLSKLITIKALRQIYETAPSTTKPALIEYIWEKRVDISKKDRINFLIDVLQYDKSLLAVEYAGRYFAKEMNLQINPIAVDDLLESWKNSKDKYK
ncbi:MAG: hypothetical protein HZB61_08860 [Nitrospirae bacterium]|nr:hypothetical protein [Nitrospirota bacterium]